jgi:hypothetical protein
VNLRSAVRVIVLGAAFAAPLRAQVVSDRARLTVGVGLGFNGGGDLWHLRDQPIIDQGGLVDSVMIGRRISSQLGVSLTATYFPNDYWGWAGEVQFLGLHYEDDCTMQTARSSEAQQICANVRGRQHDGTAVVIAGGGIFRPLPHGSISPYIRGNVGLSVSLNSSVRTIGTWVDTASEEEDYYLLGDPSPRELTPALSFGAGFTSFIGPGSQVRFEVRDNVVFLEHPLAPQAIPDPSATPPKGLRASHLFALAVSFEIVLEKRRGRRY